MKIFRYFAGVILAAVLLTGCVSVEDPSSSNVSEVSVDKVEPPVGASGTDLEPLDASEPIVGLDASTIALLTKDLVLPTPVSGLSSLDDVDETAGEVYLVVGFDAMDVAEFIENANKNLEGFELERIDVEQPAGSVLTYTGASVVYTVTVGVGENEDTLVGVSWTSVS